MDNVTSSSDLDLPLEIGGYEASTAQDIFVLTRPLDTELARALKSNGYMPRTGIVLSNGQILDGWVKT